MNSEGREKTMDANLQVALHFYKEPDTEIQVFDSAGTVGEIGIKASDLRIRLFFLDPKQAESLANDLNVLAQQMRDENQKKRKSYLKLASLICPCNVEWEYCNVGHRPETHYT